MCVRGNHLGMLTSKLNLLTKRLQKIASISSFTFRNDAGNEFYRNSGSESKRVIPDRLDFVSIGSNDRKFRLVMIVHSATLNPSY